MRAVLATVLRRVQLSVQTGALRLATDQDCARDVAAGRGSNLRSRREPECHHNTSQQQLLGSPPFTTQPGSMLLFSGQSLSAIVALQSDDGVKHSALGGIRTRTDQILNLAPLPIGLRERVMACPAEDSNLRPPD